jgi:cytochrome oxidase Cu insertion factor (SCO1/SenC/PrrC family)
MSGPSGTTEKPRAPGRRRGRTLMLVLPALILALACVALIVRHASSASTQNVLASSGPAGVEAGGGFPIDGKPAPGFTLTDQFGHAVSLSSLHGHEVVMAFIDTRCTTVCPLTAAILRNALHRIGPAAAANVDLVAINANPTATRTSDVYRFSAENGMVHEWRFLTGSPSELKAIYKAYQVYVCVLHDGDVVHTWAIYVIDPTGRERLYFQTLDSDAGVTLSSETRAIMAGMRQYTAPAQS